MVLWTCILVHILWWEFDIPVASPSWNHLDLSPCPFCLLSLVFCEIIELRVIWLCWTGWKPQNHILLVTGSSAECWTIFIAFIQLASVVEKWLNTFPWTMIKMRDHKTGWVLKKKSWLRLTYKWRGTVSFFWKQILLGTIGDVIFCSQYFLARCQNLVFWALIIGHSEMLLGTLRFYTLCCTLIIKME